MTFITRLLVMIGALNVALAANGRDEAAIRATDTDPLPGYVVVVDDMAGGWIHSLPDSVFAQRAGKVIFKVNRTELNRRAPFLADFERRVLPMAQEKNWMLVGVDIRGAASPEGPYENNVRLSHGRAKALLDYLTAKLDSVAVTFDDIKTTTVAEDYSFLLWVMEQRRDPSAPLVAGIIDSCEPGDHQAIKARLRSAENGTLWPRLLSDYYPDLRAARVILYFRTIREGIVRVDLQAPDLTRDLRVVEYEPVTPPAPPLSVDPPEIVRPHMLSISTNLLADAFYMPQYGWAPMPNIGVEFFPRSGRFTYRARFLFPYYHLWSKNKFFQIRDYHLEVRRYFRPGQNHTGAYLALYANAAKYGIGLSARKGWQGEGMGGAIKAGYVIPLGSGRWRIDFHLSAGAFVTRYDPYVYGNPVTGETDGDYYYDWTGEASKFKKRNHRFNWVGPTEIGITLSYDLLYWLTGRKGCSTHRKEVIVRP